MNDIRWLDSMSVGVHEFDDDHQQVIGLLHDIALAAQGGDPKRAHALALHLSALAAEHIRREDVFLQRIGFPGVDHVTAAQHENLGKIAALADDLLARPREAADIAMRMSQAFVAYLLRADINYKSYVEAQGLCD